MADALPTIDDILTGVAAGSCTVQQGREWIDAHVGIAEADAFDRDRTADMAMQALMTSREFVQAAKNENQNWRSYIAAESYLQADAMKTARNS